MKLFKKIRSWLAQNEFLYLLNQKRSADYQQALEEMKSCTVKSRERIAAEMKLVRDYWGIEPVHYVRYRLFAKDLDTEALLDYVPPYLFYIKYMPSQLTVKSRDYLMTKIGLAKEFAKRGIKAPETIAIVSVAGYRDLADELLPVESLLQEVVPGDTLFVKPNWGSGGYGIKVVTVYDNCNLEVSGRIVSIEEFPKMLNAGEEYVIQKALVQREDISKINPSCINTLRAITQKVGDREELKCVIMRIGRSGSQIDNSAQGGMSIVVDLDTGALANEAVTEHGGEVFTSHPDTGFVFKGQSISDWQTIKDEIISIASNFPELKLVGWDIAITTDGVVVIEINEGFGISHVQCTLGGVRRMFNIYPDVK